MKRIKKLIVINLIMLLTFTVVGCDDNDVSNLIQDDNVHENLNAVTDADKQEAPKQKAPKTKIIEKGETLTVENYCEITIKDVKFTKKVLPPNPDGFYSYYEVDEPDTIFLDIIVNIKSLLESGKAADEFANIKVIYNNKYEYRTFSIIEEDGGRDFTYTSITYIEPLRNGTLHFLAEVPEEVESGPVYILVTVNGQDYKYNVK